MKKLIFILSAVVALSIGACSNSKHTTSTLSHTSPPITGDSAMGGDAMKRDSTRP